MILDHSSFDEASPNVHRGKRNDMDVTMDVDLNNVSGTTSAKLDEALGSLKPLRDLARNWDIDIASCLEDYLQELIEISTTAKANIIPSNFTNFTHAAILLQNSSNIYSRKVEYLHSLVYTTLTELLASTAANAKSKTKEKSLTAHQRSIQEFESFDLDLNFSLLDDVLPTLEHHNLSKINLYEDEDTSLEDDKQTHEYLANAKNERLNNSIATVPETEATRVSLGGISVTKLEINTAEGAKVTTTKVMFRSLIDDMIDGGSGSCEGGSSGTLKLLGGRCTVGENGTLFIPGSSFGDINTEDEAPSDSADDACNINDVENEYDFHEEMEISNHEVSTEHEMINDNIEKAEVDCNDDTLYSEMYDANDDENDGIGFQLNPDKLPASVTKILPLSKPSAVISKYDPWLLLDPLSDDINSASKSTQLRIGKTYKLPYGVSAPPSECVTGARTKSTHLRRILPSAQLARRELKGSSRAGKVNTVSTFESIIRRKKEESDLLNKEDEADIEKTSLTETKKHRMSDCQQMGQSILSTRQNFNSTSFATETLSLNGLLFGNEFVYIVKANAKQKAMDWKVKQKIISEQPNDVSLKIKQQINEDEEEEEQYMMAHCDYDDDQSFGDYSNDAHQPCHQEANLQEDGNVSAHCFENAFGVNSDGSYDGQTFEELCRAHIKAFSVGSERYAIDTHLSRRINEWQTKISPILQEEKNRTEFDVHEYGRRIICSIKEDMEIKRRKMKRKGQKNIELENNIPPPKTVDFQSITEDSETHEVCRLFVTSLMLANSKNILLSHEAEGRSGSTSRNMLHMELLNDTLELPIEMYRLPT